MKKMHERERWKLILDQSMNRGVVKMRHIVEITGASPATVRRDLDQLTKLGKLSRFHGGFSRPGFIESPKPPPGQFDAGKIARAATKRQLASAAADLCRDGESIIINGGTTTWFMAEFLRQKRLQVLTNSFPIALELVANSSNRVILPGGEIYRDQGVILSPFDQDAIQHFTASKMFMSCHSISDIEVIEEDPVIARAEIKLLSRAEKLIVIADSSKFERRGSMAVCKMANVHTLITDEGAPENVLDAIRAQGVQVLRIPLLAKTANQ